MKRLLVAGCMVFAMIVEAQEPQLTSAGSIELAGTISFSNYKAPAADFSYSVFTFAPQISYFFLDNFSVGMSTGLGYLPGFTVVSPSTGKGSTVVQLFVSPAYYFPLDSKQHKGSRSPNGQ